MTLNFPFLGMFMHGLYIISGHTELQFNIQEIVDQRSYIQII